MNNYHLYEEIGRGKLSVVYRGRQKCTTSYVAVKSIDKTRREKLMAEARALSRLQHPNVVGFVNWYETRNHIWAILEYCAGGELSTLLKQDGMLPEEQLRLLGREICCGLLYIHCQGIIYADLKTSNILFNENGELKLSDFGHAQHLSDLSRMVEEKVPLPRRGTPNYMAPELFQQGGMHSFASDLWSCGCVLFELCTNRLPFQAANLAQIQCRVAQDPVPMLVPTSSNELTALLNSLLEKNLFDRIAWRALCEHSFWKDVSPGTAQQVSALPPQPHLDSLRCQSSPVPATPLVSVQTASSPQRCSDESNNMQQSESRTQGCLNDLLPATVHARLHQLLSDADPDVRPISKNPEIGGGLAVEEEEETPWRSSPEDHEAGGSGSSSSLPFAALGSGDVEEVEAFLTGAFRCLSKGSMPEQIRGLKYLESTCSCRIQASRTCDMRVADLVANSSLMCLVLRLLSTDVAVAVLDPVSTELKARLLSLLGELLRHATYFEPDCSDLGIFDVLLDHLGPSSTLPLARTAAAALGELLFFMAAQLAEAPNTQQTKWQPPDCVLRRVVEIATSNEEDEPLRHYLIQAMENISKQCPQVARSWFFSRQIAEGLVACLHAPVSEQLRTTCLEVFCHMVREASDEALNEGRGPHHASSEQQASRRGQQQESRTTRASRSQDGEEVCLRLQAGEAVSRGLSLSSPQALLAALRLLACSLLSFEEPESTWSCGVDDVVDLLLEILAGKSFSLVLKSLAAIDLALICLHDNWGTAMLVRLATNEVFASHFANLAESKTDFVVRSVALVMSILDHSTMLLLQRTQEETQGFVASISSHNDPGSETSKHLYHLESLIHVVSAGLLCACAVSLRTLPSLNCLWSLGSNRVASNNPVKHFQSLAADSTTGYSSKALLIELEQLANDQEGILNACSTVAQACVAVNDSSLREDQVYSCCRHLAELCISRMTATTGPFSCQSVAALMQVIVVVSQWRSVSARSPGCSRKSEGGLLDASDFIPRRLVSILRCALLGQAAHGMRGDRESRKIAAVGLEQLLREGRFEASTPLSHEVCDLLELATSRKVLT